MTANILTPNGYARARAHPPVGLSPAESDNRSAPTRETEDVRSTAECWLTDMDGVLVREEHALPGSAAFLERLIERERRFLVRTNNSIFTPRDLAARLAQSGLIVAEEAIWTSAL